MHHTVIFCIGDIGEWLPNGTLKLIDRKKQIFKVTQSNYENDTVPHENHTAPHENNTDPQGNDTDPHENDTDPHENDTDPLIK